MRDIAFSRTSYRRFGSSTRLARARDLDSVGTYKREVGQFCFANCVPEEWKETDFRMSRPSLLKLSHGTLCPHSGFAAC